MSNWIKTSDSSKKNMLFMLLTGLALTCIAFGIGTALGLNDVKKRLTENMEQLRKQCVCPPSKNGHKKASKNEMNRSISLIYENRPHLFRGLLDNEPLPA